MSGALDPLYVRARGALLDALDALEPHLDAIVLVGAQAVYLHTSDTELAVAAFDPSDTRQREIWIAGPTALVVAKLHKIGERVSANDRVHDKDALDLYRLLQAVPTEQLADGVRRLRADELSRDTTDEALDTLRVLFTRPDAEGVEMTVRAAGDPEGSDIVRASTMALAADLVSASQT